MTINIQEPGLVKLKLGLIRIQGPDAQTFLQGQLTCDLRDIDAHQARLTCYCDHKGRIIATLHLFAYESGYLIAVSDDLLATVLAELKKFAAFSKVTLEDCTDQFHIYGLTGNPDDLGELPSQSYAVTQQPDGFIMRYRSDYPVFFIISHQPITAIPPKDLNYWQWILIQLGIASINRTTTGLFTPHQLNYDLIKAVSFNKGCYRGQEIVARMHYLGKLKQRLYHAIIPTQNALANAMNIVNTDGQNVGQIINIASLEKNTFHALVTLYEDAKAKQDAFTENDKTALQFVELSYAGF